MSHTTQYKPKDYPHRGPVRRIQSDEQILELFDWIVQQPADFHGASNRDYYGRIGEHDVRMVMNPDKPCQLYAKTPKALAESHREILDRLIKNPPKDRLGRLLEI